MSNILVQQEKMNYEQYRAFCELPENEGKRFELIDGEIYAMAAPNLRHQEIAAELLFKLRGHLGKDGKCKVYVAAVDVRLNYNKADDLVLQPDLLIVCDPQKTEDGRSIRGAPDMVIEILSPSNSRHDLRVKMAQYRDAGVEEIWIVDPIHETVTVFKKIDKAVYSADIYAEDDEVPVNILENFTINSKDIFS